MNRISNFSNGLISDELAEFKEEVKESIGKNDNGHILNEWIKSCETGSYLNNLKNKLYNSADFLEAESIEQESQLALILISTEIVTWYTHNIKASNSDKNTALHNYFSMNHTLNGVLEKVEHEQGVILYENLIKCSSDLIKHYYLMYEKQGSNKTDIFSIHPPEFFLNAIKHHISVDKSRFINELINNYQFSNLLVDYNVVNDIYEFHNDDCEFIESYYIYNLRNKTIQSQHEAEFINFEHTISRNVENSTIEFPPKKGRIIEELFSYVGLVYRLFVDDLNVSCNINSSNVLEIDIKLLLRAFTVLIQISKEYINNSDNNINIENSVNNTCIVLSQDELNQVFIEAGIEESCCKNIIEALTFNDKSEISDCPLIRLDDNYIIVSSICAHTMAHLAIMSRVSEFKFQGEKLETLLIDRLNSKNIKAISKKINADNEEYQCDLLFVLENDLYICECKAWGDARSLRGYYEQFLKKKDAAKQLNRIADFYTKNVNYIKSDLEKNRDWLPRKVHRLLITNTMIGDVEPIDGVRIIDFSYFDKFIKREKPKLYNDGVPVKELKGYAVFDGNITRKRMNDFIYSDLPIRLAKARALRHEEEINLFDNKLIFKNYIDRLPNYIIADANAVSAELISPIADGIACP